MMEKRSMGLLLTILIGWMTVSIHAESPQTPLSMGLPIGGKVPPFEVRDQLGRPQTLTSLSGPQGLVLLFFRSADW